MRKATSLLCAVLLLCASLPRSTFAQTKPQVDEENAEAVPLEKGDPAPFPGVLLSDTHLTKYLNLEIRLQEAEGHIRARDTAILKLQDSLAMAKTKSWWERNSFWLGVGTGMAVSVLLIWGAAETIDNLK